MRSRADKTSGSRPLDVRRLEQRAGTRAGLEYRDFDTAGAEVVDQLDNLRGVGGVDLLEHRGRAGHTAVALDQRPHLGEKARLDVGDGLSA